MNTAVINIKTDSRLKEEAQKIAKDLGFSLSSLMNAYLRQLVKAKTVHFSLNEEPTPYMLNSLKESEADIKAGKVSPSFDEAEEAIAWLNNPKAKYANEI